MKKKITALALVVAILAIAIIGGTLAYFTDESQVVSNTFTAGNVKIDLYEMIGNEKTAEGKAYEEAIMPGRVFDKEPIIEVEEKSQDAYVFLDMTLNKYKSLVPVMALDAAADEKIDFTDADVEKCMVDGKFSTLTFLNNMQAKPAVFRAIVDKWFIGIDHENWEVCGFFYDTKADDTTAKGNWMTIRLAYIGKGDPVLSAGETVSFMTNFQMPASVTQEMIENGRTANQFNEGDAFSIKFKAYAIQADQLDTVDAAFTALFGSDLGEFWKEA